MPTIIGSPPILDSSGNPANGFIRVSASRAFQSGTGHVTTAWATARVTNGVPTMNSAPWTLPATPEGIWYRLEQDLDGDTVVRYGVRVPDVKTLTYPELIFNRGMVGLDWESYWWDLTGGLDFPPEALPGDMGIDTITGDYWRNQ